MLLDYFKDSPDCLYIYNKSSLIYGLDPNLFKEYIIILKDNFEFNDDINKYKYIDNIYKDDGDFIIYTIDEWFNKVFNCDLECWEASCTRKPIKEHVKLMLSVDLLKLRKNIDLKYSLYKKSILNVTNIEHMKILCWNIIKDLKFTNQIIEHHKILNYKSSSSDWALIKNINEVDELIDITNKSFYSEYKILSKFTDGILKQEKLNKIINSKI